LALGLISTQRAGWLATPTSGSQHHCSCQLWPIALSCSPDHHTLPVPLQYNRHAYLQDPTFRAFEFLHQLAYYTPHPIPYLQSRCNCPLHLLSILKTPFYSFFLQFSFPSFSNSDSNSMALLSLTISFGIYRNRLLRNTMPYCSTVGF